MSTEYDGAYGSYGYGTSVDDDQNICVSPGTMAQFTFRRRGSNNSNPNAAEDISLELPIDDSEPQFPIQLDSDDHKPTSQPLTGLNQSELNILMNHKHDMMFVPTDRSITES